MHDLNNPHMREISIDDIDKLVEEVISSGAITNEMCYQCETERLYRHELLCAKCFTERQGSS